MQFMISNSYELATAKTPVKNLVFPLAGDPIAQFIDALAVSCSGRIVRAAYTSQPVLDRRLMTSVDDVWLLGHLPRFGELVCVGLSCTLIVSESLVPAAHEIAQSLMETIEGTEKPTAETLASWIQEHDLVQVAVAHYETLEGDRVIGCTCASC
jgi:hypothetical protein